MQISLDNLLVKVSVIRKNNKRIYFRYKSDNILYVYANYLISDKEIEKLIIKNKSSIINLINKSNTLQEDSNYFYYLGNKYEIIYSDIEGYLFDDDCIFIKDRKSLDKFYSRECIRIFNERVDVIKSMFSNIPDFTLKLRKMKTRWGVCNCTKKIITLNTELLKKKIHLLDYVIIHEICHFYEANHSESFWKCVSEYYPNYKLARKELRNYE